MNDHVAKTIKVYDEIAQDYARQADSHAPVVDREKFIQQVQPKGKILDAGCGSGRDSKFFSNKGFKTVGIDLSEKLLEIARINSPQTKFIKADLRNLPFAKDYFDGIWATASLVHLTRRETPKVIGNFFKILKPGGVLYLKVKAGKGEKYIYQPSVSKSTKSFCFYCFYSKTEIKQLLMQYNFKILALSAYDEGTYYPDRKGRWWIAGFAQKPFTKTDFCFNIKLPLS